MSATPSAAVNTLGLGKSKPLGLLGVEYARPRWVGVLLCAALVGVLVLSILDMLT